MQIRKGTATDLPFILDLTKRAAASSYPVDSNCRDTTAHISEYIERSTHTFETALNSDNHSVYVATLEDALLGYVIVIHDTPEIDYIMVDPTAHGTGAGKALMIAALDALAERGARSNVRLIVVAENARAQAFYRKFGFTVTGPATTRSVAVVEMERAA
jgi:ribosomal protein S18 acetylase RimI-like enzyme